jgi:hypothetical protein
MSGKDHVGRRRAVHVARRVEASVGWCVYSSVIAVTAKLGVREDNGEIQVRL